MLGSQHPDKSAVGRKRTDSASASITEKSNLQLLNEVETENMHIAQFHEKRDSESPYLDNDYEGYEDGI